MRSMNDIMRQCKNPEHWYNRETGQVECDECCGNALDDEARYKRLYEKLKPYAPRPDESETILNMRRYKPDGIRSAAESFSRMLEDDLPQTEGEMREMLWVFGHLTSGAVQSRYDYAMKLLEDVQNVSIKPTVWHVSGPLPNCTEISEPTRKELMLALDDAKTMGADVAIQYFVRRRNALSIDKEKSDGAV